MPRPGQLRRRHLGQVGQPVDGREPGAALQPGRERLAQQPRAGGTAIRLAASSPGRRSAAPPSRITARLAAAQRLGRVADHLVAAPARRAGRDRRRGLGRRRTRTRRRAGSAWRSRPRDGRRHRLGRVAGHVGAAQRPPHPPGHRPGQRVDVGLQRRVEAACGRSRGRRPRSPAGCPPAARCAGWPARSPGPGPGAAAPRRAARSSARTRPPRRSPPPRTGTSTPRICGTASSAATKCISEVPGLLKHTSTPAPVSVRISACAPFIPPLSSGR